MTTNGHGAPPDPAQHPLAGRIARRKKKQQSTTVLLYGPDGIGKTSFGKRAPRPFFLCAEDSDLPDHVVSLTPESWSDALGIVRDLRANPMGCQTFVVDTVDWLEPKAVRHVCQRDNARLRGKLILPDGRTDLDGYGYGKGSSVLLEEWRLLLAELEALRVAHDMNVVLLGHAGRHRVKNAEGDDYDLIGPKVDKKVADLLCEWPKAVLYAEFQKTVIERADDDRAGGKAKVVTDGSRVCWTQNRGAHRAKNRFGMPETIPFSWDDFARYALADVDALRARLDARLAALGDADRSAKAREFVAARHDEAGAYLATIERVEKLLAETKAKEAGR